MGPIVAEEEYLDDSMMITRFALFCFVLLCLCLFILNPVYSHVMMPVFMSLLGGQVAMIFVK